MDEEYDKIHQRTHDKPQVSPLLLLPGDVRHKIHRYVLADRVTHVRYLQPLLARTKSIHAEAVDESVDNLRAACL